MPKLQNPSDISQPWLPSWYSLMRCPELNSGSRQCRTARRPRNVATSPRDRRARTRGDFHRTLSAWRNSVATFSLRGSIHGGGGMKWMPLGFPAPGACVYRTRFPLRLTRRPAGPSLAVRSCSASTMTRARGLVNFSLTSRRAAIGSGSTTRPGHSSSPRTNIASNGRASIRREWAARRWRRRPGRVRNGLQSRGNYRRRWRRSTTQMLTR
jgi:hypothetical protein